MDPLLLLNGFRTEASEHLSSLEVQLLQLERKPRDLRPIREMFRSAHTIKGGAALLGLPDVLELAHAVEDVLAPLRDRTEGLEAATIELLFRAIDALRNLATGARPGHVQADLGRDRLVAALRRHAMKLTHVDQSATAVTPAELSALVVDDSSTVRLLTTMLLADVGFAVHAVADGRQALADALVTRYDLVVTAVETTGLGGLELVGALRDSPTCRDLPVILISSNDDPEKRRRAAALGVQAYLPKGSLSDVRIAETALRLVARSVDGTSAAEQPCSPPPAPGRQSGPVQRVLIVEDSELHQRVAVSLVQALGYGADVAGTGGEAFQALAGGCYDAVLLDCHLPDMDGAEASQEIRHQEGSGWSIPIIAMTADSTAQDRDRCLAAGMNAFLTKPVQKDELAVCLRRWMQRAQPATVDTRPPERASRAGSGPAARECDSAIDTEALRGLRALVRPGQPDPVGPLIQLFLNETAARLADCGEAVAGDHAQLLADAAHALKGNSGTFGAHEMHRLAQELEQGARAGSAAGVADLLAALQSEFVRVGAALERFTTANAPQGDSSDDD